MNSKARLILATATPAKSGAIHNALVWLGFAEPVGTPGGGGHGGHAAHGGAHGHTHGTIDASITTNDRGIWAIKWSFIILGITCIIQIAVVVASSSVALLADAIHNVGDAATAIPLWIAFTLARRKPSARFPYGLGRVEDLAGVSVVAIILISALVAGYEALDRLIHPQTVLLLPWVAAAGVVGFIGNEVVAVFRIRVGREIDSAALIADGYHARTDGLTSLAVVAGAVGVWLGFPLADPIIGLLITITILGIVWQSSKAVFTRMLDGIEPDVVAEIRHAAEHVPGVLRIVDVRARWLGHRLIAELDVAAAGNISLREADDIADSLEHEITGHLPAVGSARVRVLAGTDADTQARPASAHPHPHPHGNHAAPAPQAFTTSIADGKIEIVDTPAGERFRVTLSEAKLGLRAAIAIARPAGEELHVLNSNDGVCFEGDETPAEPHEFEADLSLEYEGRRELRHFAMTEPEGHAH